MKKSKVLLSIILVLSLLVVSILPVFAESVTALDEVFFSTWENKLDKILSQKIKTTDDNDTISVALWLKEPNDTDRKIERATVNKSIDFNALVMKEKDDILKSTHENVDERKVLEIATEQAKLVVSNSVERNLIKRNNDRIIGTLKSKYRLNDKITYVSRYAPLVTVNIERKVIRRIVADSNIVKMYYVDPNEDLGIEEYNNENRDVVFSMPSYGLWQKITGIETLRNIHHNSGLGVKIGHIEGAGVPNRDDSIFSYAYNNIYLLGINPPSGHASFTAGLLVGKTIDYMGVAINSRLYCSSFANTDPVYYGYNVFTKKCMIIEDILDNNINILNASIYFGDTPTSVPTYDKWSAFLDYIVSYYHTTVCISAGNVGQVDYMYSGAAAYNVITVGNIDDKNTLDTNDDIWHNSFYYSSNTLQYKPDLCAPGHRAGLPGSNGIGGGGTSAAAPIVSGICAMLMEEEPSLKNNPMLMKSVLLSSAKRIANMNHQTTPEYSSLPAMSHKYGAGMVNALYASQIAENNRYDSYTESDWNGVSYITIDIPYYNRDLQNQRRIYASACWEELVEINVNNSFISHNAKKYYIELWDPNNFPVSGSLYEYDRKQVLGYQPTEVGTYKLRITKYWASNEYTNLSVSYNKPLDN